MTSGRFHPRLHLRGLALSFVVVGLAGCASLGPDFKEPEIAWLERWQPEVFTPVRSTEPGEGERFWRQLFDDPALVRLIAAARESNPSLKIAGLRVLESRAQLGIADSNRYPQLQTADGSATYVRNRTSGGATPNQDVEFLSKGASLTLGWELDFWGRFRRAIESADAAFFASLANQRDAQVLLVAQVAEAYYGYRTTEARIRIARENAQIQKRSLEITQRLFKSGAESELDLQQAKTQYLATLAVIPDLEASRVALRNGLCVLLGRPPGQLPELKSVSPRLPKLHLSRLGAIPAGVLARRPDVRAAAWQAASQSAQIGFAEADFYPYISLGGSLSWSATSVSGSLRETTFGLGPGFKWNLFDHGRIANNVRVQDARLQQALESYQAKVLLAAKEVDDAAVKVQKTLEQDAVLEQSVTSARRALELSTSLYREGYVDFQRVLDAQRAAYSQAERQLLNRGAHVNAGVELYKALGGGWRDSPIETLVPAKTREQMRQRTDWGALLDAPLPIDPQPQSAGKQP